MSPCKITFVVQDIYNGSDRGATGSLLAALTKIKPFGRIAAELFRVQKASRRAKQLRGGIRSANGKLHSYRDLLYSKKEKVLETVCDELIRDACGLSWGWGVDKSEKRNSNVLFVDLPTGQVSFHSPRKFNGPDYTLGWNAKDSSERRIVRFCQTILDEEQKRHTNS